jgi:hypothetical protein
MEWNQIHVKIEQQFATQNMLLVMELHNYEIISPHINILRTIA